MRHSAQIEVSWFDRTDVGFGYKCRTGLPTSEPCSPWLTDADNAHTDNALQSHLTAEMMRGRPEKRGARARRSHDTQEHANASCAPRGEHLVDMQMVAGAVDRHACDLLIRGGVG